MATRRAVAPLLGHELPRLSQFDAFRSSLIVMCSARKSLNSPEKCRWSQATVAAGFFSDIRR